MTRLDRVIWGRIPQNGHTPGERRPDLRYRILAGSEEEFGMTRITIASWLVALALAAGGLSACGVKGPLEPPPPKDAQEKEKTS